MDPSDADILPFRQGHWTKQTSPISLRATNLSTSSDPNKKNLIIVVIRSIKFSIDRIWLNFFFSESGSNPPTRFRCGFFWFDNLIAKFETFRDGFLRIGQIDQLGTRIVPYLPGLCLFASLRSVLPFDTVPSRQIRLRGTLLFDSLSLWIAFNTESTCLWHLIVYIYSMYISLSLNVKFLLLVTTLVSNHYYYWLVSLIESCLSMHCWWRL